MGNPEGGNNHWSVRLTAARDAQSRTRFAFVAATIVAVAIAIAEYNSTFSWYIQFLLTPNFPGDSTVTAEAQKVLVQEWVKSDRMNISLLGVNIGMSDAAILGSMSLYILSLWFFVCIRRENHLIADLLTDASSNANHEIQVTVFHGIADYLVFTTITKDDEPKSALGHRSHHDHQLFYFRPSLQALIFLPACATAFILLSDITSLFFDAPLRFPHVPLWSELIKKPIALLQVGFSDAIAIAFGTASLFMCLKIRQFESATGDVLRAFYEKHIKVVSLSTRAGDHPMAQELQEVGA